jgi:hypothetical protein
MMDFWHKTCWLLPIISKTRFWFMDFRLFVLPALLVAQSLHAQTALLHPGQICCSQDLCPNVTLPLINEVTATTPLDTVISIEYRWQELVLDPNAPNGTRWRVLEGQTGRTFQPTAINNPFGGFFMRSARQAGTLVYLNSNVVNYRILTATDPVCTSSTGEAATDSRVILAPNPGNDQLQLTIMDASKTADEAFVFDTSGRLVWRSANLQSGAATINSTTWPAGVFTVMIRYKDGSTDLKRWVKLRAN